MKICLSRWCFMDFCVDFYGAGYLEKYIIKKFIANARELWVPP